MCDIPNVDTFLNNNCLEYATYTEKNQEYYDRLFKNTYPDGNIYIPGVNSDIDKLSFQHLLVDLCNYSDNGRFCRKPLIELCSNYTRNDTLNSNIKQMCGCYLPDINYSDDQVRSCDTLCSNSSTIQYYSNSEQIIPTQCITNACIIDNITIESINSNVGDITFNQICPFCRGAANCQCIINDVNIITRNSSIGTVTISQNCGSSSKCLSRTSYGTQEEVPCDEYFSEFGENVSYTIQIQTISYRMIIVLAILIFLLLILFIIAYIYGVISPKPTVLTYVTQNINEKHIPISEPKFVKIEHTYI